MGFSLKKLAGPLAAVAAPLTALPFVGGLLGGSGPKATQINAAAFNLDPEAKKAAELAEAQRAGAVTRSGAAQQGQQQLMGQLQAQANGTGPSLAAAQLKSAASRSLANQLAAAASQRGGSVAAQQRALVMQQGATGRDLAAQSAEARMAEAGQARQQLGQMLQNEQQLSDTLAANYLQKGYDFATATKMAQQQLALAQAGMNQQNNMAKYQGQQQMMGGLMSGAASLGSAMAMAPALASDERQKENVSDAKTDTKKFLDALSAKSYNYKDTSVPGTAEGRRYGIMAQDLEKSEMGKSLVKDGPDGVKRIDTTQGFGAVLAAQSELNKRLKALERKKKA